MSTVSAPSTSQLKSTTEPASIWLGVATKRWITTLEAFVGPVRLLAMPQPENSPSRRASDAGRRESGVWVTRVSTLLEKHF